MKMSSKKNNSISSSMIVVRTSAFIVCCVISIFLNLNMLILFASTFIEKIVFISISIGIEGAKIYYITMAPIYKKLEKKAKSKVYYMLYAICAFISISAAYGFVTTTIQSTEVITNLQSNQEKIVRIDNDIKDIDQQIFTIQQKQLENKNIFQKDILILDSQINILIQEIAKSPPIKEDPIENTDVKERDRLRLQNSRNLKIWEQKIAKKKKELENLKVQKKELIVVRDQKDEKLSSQLNKLRNERDIVLAKQDSLKTEEAKSLESGAFKTDMFTAVGKSFGLDGSKVMTIILLLIALTIESGIVATAPDPNLTLRVLHRESLSPIKPVESALPPAPVSVKKPERKSKEKTVKHSFSKKQPAFKPMFKRNTATPVQNVLNKSITTIVEKKALKQDISEEELKKKMSEFLSQLYGRQEEAKQLVTMPVAIKLSKIDSVIANRFFERIVNIQGPTGKPLFTYINDEDRWYANYPLSYLLDMVIPRVRINYHEEKKQVI